MVYRTNKKINNYTFINEEKEFESDFNTLNLKDNPFLISLFMINKTNVEDDIMLQIETVNGIPIQHKKCIELESYYNSTNNTAFQQLKEKMIKEKSQTIYNSTLCLLYDDNTFLMNNKPSTILINIFFKKGFIAKPDDYVYFHMHYLDPEVYVNNYFNP